MNRYNFSGNVVAKDKFPKCKECNSSWIAGHECPGPKIPTYDQKMPEDNGLPPTVFQQIWHNANEQMREEEDIGYDPSWDDPDE